jgi:streptogramin lyase
MRFRMGSAIAVLVVAPATGLAAAGDVTEFSAGISKGSAPLAITNGPDGNMWFTQAGGSRPVVW